MAENVSFQKVTTEYYDVLKELGNIGAGNATTALAQMLQTKVDMKVPQHLSCSRRRHYREHNVCA